MKRQKVMTFLRITFCILACICAAATVPVGIFFNWWAIAPIAAMGLFALLMIGAKNDFRSPNPPPRVDFMNSDEENETLRRNDKK